MSPTAPSRRRHRPRLAGLRRRAAASSTASVPARWPRRGCIRRTRPSRRRSSVSALRPSIRRNSAASPASSIRRRAWAAWSSGTSRRRGKAPIMPSRALMWLSATRTGMLAPSSRDCRKPISDEVVGADDFDHRAPGRLPLAAAARCGLAASCRVADGSGAQPRPAATLTGAAAGNPGCQHVGVVVPFEDKHPGSGGHRARSSPSWPPTWSGSTR